MFQYIFNDRRNSSIHCVLAPAIALKIRESIGIPNSQSESSLESVKVYSPHFLSLLGSLSARNLASPCLGHEPNARVATSIITLKCVATCKITNEQTILLIVLRLAFMKQVNSCDSSRGVRPLKMSNPMSYYRSKSSWP
jgi:hypothetical protein